MSKERFDLLVEKIQEEIPKFEIRYKDESKSQKAIGKVMFFNKRYMTDFSTTLYPYVYFPTRQYVEDDYERAFFILAHEFVHLIDHRERGFWFTLSYALPQALGLLSLFAFGAFWNLWFLFFLLALGFFAPIPSPWRTNWEVRGYTMNLALSFWMRDTITEELRVFIESKFSGWDYYKMCPNQEKVIRLLTDNIKKIRDGSIVDENEAFGIVRNIVVSTP